VAFIELRPGKKLRLGFKSYDIARLFLRVDTSRLIERCRTASKPRIRAAVLRRLDARGPASMDRPNEERSRAAAGTERAGSCHGGGIPSSSSCETLARVSKLFFGERVQRASGWWANPHAGSPVIGGESQHLIFHPFESADLIVDLLTEIARTRAKTSSRTLVKSC
jgi:hypothetical protein